MSILDVEQTDISIKNINMYRNEEKMNFDDISDVLTEINYNYDTNNSKNLYNTCNNLTKKLETIQAIHSNYVNLFENTIVKYDTTAKEISQKFEDII